ncbi:LPS assembly protein LptD [Aquincola sp. MAHUQ-54]|uniref:LPS-assembly protein LptD n=1 Tax=Aquincola agrisoli TaxID=3119538 RepID=A0AAW9QJ23_9BURK
MPTPLAAAAALCCAQVAAQPAAPAAAASAPAAAASAPGATPVLLQADRISGRPDLEAQAEGNAELQRGPITIRADRLSYDSVSDLAKAEGSVRITHEGNRFTGPELQLQLQRFEGYFLQPEYFFAATGAGGQADRIDFIDDQRSQLWGATYSSCGVDGGGGPAWLLESKRIRLDREANEGVAEGAVLRFYGVPILGAPVMSFPLSDQRKSGWLPPSLNLDNKSGVEVGVPYYWNIAPNRDATITPTIMTRRGLSADAQFRYLEPRYEGVLDLHLLPHDRVTGASRHAFRLFHEGDASQGIHYRLEGLRVSDDEYWKDFSQQSRSWTPRLLATDLRADRRFDWNGLDATVYGRVQAWQVLQQDDARIVAPYQRSPQLGLRGSRALAGGFETAFETEVNHFTRPTDGQDTLLPTGTRVHALGSISRPWRAPGWWVVPKLAVNTAQYQVDRSATGRYDVSRTIPTFSLDAGMVFEREAQWFGKATRQTLEPRLFYVNTPYRDQRDTPNFDAYGKDFNAVSVYSDNDFSGIDRVSDANMLTAGVTTRLIDAATGAERLRLGMAQRVRFRDQRLVANPDGTPNIDAAQDEAVSTQRLSDLLVFGTAALSPRWSFDGAVQYDPDSRRTVRSLLSARYSPGPFRTISTSYRLARGLSEQLELGWQWPLYRRDAAAAARSGAGACSGTLYGVGRLNYSLRDSRITDSIVGVEYDAGCWIGRIVAERLSTGRSEATTRLLLQLELVGLSRLGSNPLKVLKDNVPGYRLLRDDPDAAYDAAVAAPD